MIAAITMVAMFSRRKIGVFATREEGLAYLKAEIFQRTGSYKIRGPLNKFTFLTDDEKVTACTLAKAAGADFVKTSTGFGPGGATVADACARCHAGGIATEWAYHGVTEATYAIAAGATWLATNDAPLFSADGKKSLLGDRKTEDVVQWIFSDGLASVSLFVEEYDGKRHQQEGVFASGATHTLTRRVQDWWVTAVGEVPSQTLKAFAVNLERRR